jgi:hypothetical protein
MSLPRVVLITVALIAALPLTIETCVGHFQAPTAETVGGIQGVVLDGDGNPIPDANVYALPQEDMVHRRFDAKTDDSGKFALAGLPPSNVYYLFAYKEAAGYPDEFFSFFGEPGFDVTKATVRANETTGNVVIRRGPKYALLEIAVSGGDGKPNDLAVQLDFSRPDIPGPYGTAMKMGSTRSMLVPPVPFRLTVSAEGFAPWSSDPIKLKSGETFHLDVTLRPPP